MHCAGSRHLCAAVGYWRTPVTDKGMVVTPQPEATEAGRDILAAGGNAVDAAIAAALVQTVVDPLMCGIAGFGSLAVYLPSKRVHI